MPYFAPGLILCAVVAVVLGCSCTAKLYLNCCISCLELYLEQPIADLVIDAVFDAVQLMLYLMLLCAAVAVL